MQTLLSKNALPAIVLLHLAVTAAHGFAHVGAAVPVGAAGMAFVVVVIQIGPLAGLAYMRIHRAFGAFIVAGTMGAALVFGLVNHFVVQGGDHVGHVATAWQPLFASTAVLLVLTESLGAALAAWTGSRAFRRVA